MPKKTLDPSRYESNPIKIRASLAGLMELSRKKAPFKPAREPRLWEDTKRFELIDPTNNHKKFWEITLWHGTLTARSSIELHWGRIGTKGDG